MQVGFAQDAYDFTIQHQAMGVAGHADIGLYFGTYSTSIFARIDDGASWSGIAPHLPIILLVEVA